MPDQLCIERRKLVSAFYVCFIKFFSTGAHDGDGDGGEGGGGEGGGGEGGGGEEALIVFPQQNWTPP